MNPDHQHFDFAVIGSGPSGQQAAIQAARAGNSVVIVEQEVGVGGACVFQGTIPSKTLRETALALQNFQSKSGNVCEMRMSEDLQVASLMTRREAVSEVHSRHMAEELFRNGVEHWHGRASFESEDCFRVISVDRNERRVSARFIIIATGSRPRTPPEIPIDHEHLLDSDSILSMIYLPSSLTVLGGGVIASEYASIFVALGVDVTMVDSHALPLGFLDPEIAGRFLKSYERAGGHFIGDRRVESAEWDDVSAVRTRLDDGTVLTTDKLLCCLGREANLAELEVERAGLSANSRGHVPVNENLQTAVPHIYAVGDVIGPPALASTSMDQGRRAICHALGIDNALPAGTIPMGIYTIPEISSVGLNERQALDAHGSVMVGRAGFDKVARGQIAHTTDGLLKLVADGEGRRLLGIQIVGEGASELIHVGQMAMLNDRDVDVFVDTIFNFPTLAEAYRVAALDLVWQRSARTVEPALT